MKLKYFLAASIAGVTGSAILPAPTAAQQITSSIQGTVSSDQGTSIAGATVVVTDSRTQAKTTLTTSNDGRFSATGLVAGGPYTVTVTAPGFEGQTLNDVNISVQGATSLSYSLTASANAATIVVTGSRVGITQLAVGPSQSFSGEVLTSAPSYARDIRDIIRIDPRVSLDREDASTGGDGQDHISCLGANSRTNSFTVDGILQGDVFGLNGTGFASRSSTPIPYDAVREVQVQFAPYDVEYDQFTGCQINVITQSGTNTIHGSAFFEYSGSGMRGDNVDGQPVAPVQDEKHWGVSLGGPIIKDRLWLFGAYSHQETGQSFDFGPEGANYTNASGGVTLDQFNQVSQILKDTYGIDTGPLATNLPFTNDRYFVRGDFEITDGQRLELSYQHLDESTVKEDDYFNSYNGSTVTGYNNFYISGTKSNYYSARLYSDWTDNFSTEIRYSHSKVTDKQDPVGGGEAQSDNPIPRIIVGTDTATGYGAILAGPGQYRSANALETTIDQGTIVGKYLAGDHNFKFGADFDRVKIFDLFIVNATGTLVFNSIADLQSGTLANSTDTHGYASYIHYGESAGAFGNFTASGDPNDAAADFSRTLYGVFAQDSWQMTDNLNLTVGGRLNWIKGDSPVENPYFQSLYGFTHTTGFDAFGPVFLPRAALVYDMDDFSVFSRARLRAGAGLFTGGDPLVWIANAFQNNGYGTGLGATDYPSYTGRTSSCPAGPLNVLPGGVFSGVPACIVADGSAAAAAGIGRTDSVDPNIKWSKVLRLNLGFESDLDFAPSGFFSGWRINLDYIFSHYINPFDVVDLAQSIDTAKGLNGYTIDGRPIYQSTSGRVEDIMFTNAGGYNSQSASIFLQKQFDRGIFTDGGSVRLTLGYAWNDAHDRRNMDSSISTSNYSKTAATDLNNPDVARSFFASKSNFTVSANFAEEFVDDLKTRLNLTFVARSGRPYSLTFYTYNSIFHDRGAGQDNALLYIPDGVNDPNIAPTSDPVAVQALYDFTSNLDCAKGYAGSTIARNTCSYPWYYDMDLSFSQEIPGPMRVLGLRNDKLKLFASIDNFLNLLSSGGNLQHRGDYRGIESINIAADGVDSQGRYVINYDYGTTSPQDTFNQGQFINVTSSVWRLKIGLSYKF